MRTWLYWVLVATVTVFVALPVTVALWWFTPGYVPVLFLVAYAAAAILVDRVRRHSAV